MKCLNDSHCSTLFHNYFIISSNKKIYIIFCLYKKLKELYIYFIYLLYNFKNKI